MRPAIHGNNGQLGPGWHRSACGRAGSDLRESASIGRSTGTVPDTIPGIAARARAFLDGLDIRTCDVLGFSLGGM
jgi:pimeloyl-ACP methyl ester carboxylesterase